jgi:hypothetical protein
MTRVAIAALLGTLVGLGLGWGLFGEGSLPVVRDPAAAGAGPDDARSTGPVGTARAHASASETVGALVPERARPAAVEGTGGGTCPASAELASRERTIASLLQRLGEASNRAAQAEAAAEGPRYDAPTAAGRRAQAAGKGNLLVEFPDWQERLTLRDGVADEHGLDAGRARELEELYAASNARLREALQKLYADLVGDPQAGSTSTLNALLHDVMSLSPQEACNQKLPALLQALAEGSPPPAPGPEPLPCEEAVRLVFQAVDALDQQAVRLAGEAARKALWSGSSTFEFGSRR